MELVNEIILKERNTDIDGITKWYSKQLCYMYVLYDCILTPKNNDDVTLCNSIKFIYHLIK